MTEKTELEAKTKNTEPKVMKLDVKIRAVPSKGRARVNTSTLKELDIDEEKVVEIVPAEAGFLEKRVYAKLYADNLVEDGIIRISKLDCEKLGVSEGESVYVRPWKKKDLLEKLHK